MFGGRTSVGVTDADLSSVGSVGSLPKKSAPQPKSRLCEGGPPCGAPNFTASAVNFFFEFRRYGREGYQGQKVILFNSTGK